MPSKKKDLVKCLTGKFRFSQLDGTKHETYGLIVNDIRVATIRFSRSWEDIGDNMMSQLGRELGVDRKQLLAMCECTISRDRYIEILEGKNQ
jgi:hypothetical protein